MLLPSFQLSARQAGDISGSNLTMAVQGELQVQFTLVLAGDDRTGKTGFMSVSWLVNLTLGVEVHPLCPIPTEDLLTAMYAIQLVRRNFVAWETAITSKPNVPLLC